MQKRDGKSEIRCLLLDEINSYIDLLFITHSIFILWFDAMFTWVQQQQQQQHNISKSYKKSTHKKYVSRYENKLAKKQQQI